MTNKELFQKIRAEIERLYDGKAPKHAQQCDFDDGYFTGIGAISKFLDTLSEEPSESLEEAAEEYASDYPAWNDEQVIAKYAFKRGAEWQKGQDLAEMGQSKSPLSVAYANRCFENGKQAMKEQMLKEAMEGQIYGSHGDYWIESEIYENLKGKEGDKVRIIIVKEENK